MVADSSAIEADIADWSEELVASAMALLDGRASVDEDGAAIALDELGGGATLDELELDEAGGVLPPQALSVRAAARISGDPAINFSFMMGFFLFGRNVVHRALGEALQLQ